MKKQNNVNMYPTTMKEFNAKMMFVLQREKGSSRVEYLKQWLAWFDSTGYEFKGKLKENEFLKPYYSLPNTFALQVWERNGEYNIVKYNLVANKYDEYNDDNTIIIRDE